MANDEDFIESNQISELTQFFPFYQVEEDTGSGDQYLLDLVKIVKDNYMAGNFQVAFFYCHLIFMSFIYYAIDNVHFFESGRSEDLIYSMNAYRTQENKKPDLKKLESVYQLSTIPEKEIFKIFKSIGMEDSVIGEFSKYVSDRDDYAHATGKGNFSVEEFITKFNTIVKNAENINSLLDKKVIDDYIGFLIESCDNDYYTNIAVFEAYIYRLRLSKATMISLSKLGLSNYRNRIEGYIENYSKIKNSHCAFLEKAGEMIGCDLFDETNRKWAQDNYCYYKYKNNAKAYMDNILGLDEFTTIKDGGELPLYECPDCGEKQLVFDHNLNKYLCFSCGETKDNIGVCARCGTVCHIDDEGFGLCEYCKDKTEKE